MIPDLEAKAQRGDPEALALLHFLRLLRGKVYEEARAYAQGFEEPWRSRLLAGLRFLEEGPEALEDPLFAAERAVVLGVKAVRAGKREEAERLFREALALDPKHHRALVNLANLHLERGALEEAERLYGEALRLAPEDPLVHENLAALYKRKGDLDRMVAHLKRANRLKFRPPPPLDPVTGRPQRRFRLPLWVWLGLLALLLYYLLHRP